MTLEKEVNNEIKNELNNSLENTEKNFLPTILKKTINNAIDFGLRTILPDLIEEQVIDIKNSLFENGLKDGIRTAVDSTIDLGRSAMGIFTGNFENMQQIETVIGNGGIIDSISTLIDKASNRAYELGYINKTVNTIITKGKDILLDNISSNIKNELEEQTNSTQKLEKYINNWKEYYNNKDFEGMDKVYNKIKEQLEKVVPLENILKETRRVESMHNLISNNGHNFEISDVEKQMIETFNK